MIPDNSIPPPLAEPQPQLPGLGVNDFAIAPQLMGGGVDCVSGAIPTLTDCSIGAVYASDT